MVKKEAVKVLIQWFYSVTLLNYKCLRKRNALVFVLIICPVLSQLQFVLCSASTLYAKQMQNMLMKASWETAVYAIEIGLNQCSLLNNLDRWIAMPLKMYVIHSWMSWCTSGCKMIMRTKMFAWSFILCKNRSSRQTVCLQSHYSSSILLYFVQCCKHLSCHQGFIRLSCVPFRQILIRLWPFLFRHKSSPKRTDHPFRRVGVCEKRQERFTGEIVPQFPISKWK